jgi:CxxC motif-containing protein (DUF1111 family)
MPDRTDAPPQLALALALALLSACELDPDPTAEPGEALAGGDTTIFDATQNAFSLPARNLSDLERERFAVGNSFFNKNWVTAPASTAARDGLGPTFNARSCSACHLRDGRGRPPSAPGEPLLGLLFRLSLPGADADPTYGDQLQPYAIDGVPAEGDVQITYTERPGVFADGQPYSRRVPTYTLTAPAFGPFHPDLLISPRVAPAMIGLGLLAAIPEADLLARADPDDLDGDGVSGRPNYAWEIEPGRLALGRFGWKASQTSVLQQVAGAFIGDIGVTSRLFPHNNCPAPQQACAAAPHGGEPELSDALLAEVTFYSAALAVPARRGVDDPQVLRGKAQFHALGCAACHVPTWRTAPDGAGHPALADQQIWPYTDLLLHDMGPELADHRPDLEATGAEWRTPPLWGIGLLEIVSGHTDLLHDGRARDLNEAILWHGGEAQAARDAFIAASAAERDDLLTFLRSL